MSLEYEFALVDDDAACRRMLKAIIEGEGLGYVVVEKENGSGAADLIERSGVDIAIIDLLLPGEDGVSIMKSLSNAGYKGSVVMLSQVETKDMIAKAYAAGIDFFINKPINRIEVIAVLDRVMEQMRMRHSLGKLKNLVVEIDQTSQGRIAAVKEKDVIKIKTQNILSDLGIIGEAGSEDLIQIILFLKSVPDSKNYLGDFRHLKNLYAAIGERYKREKLNDSTDPRAIEQRIRRAVKKGFENVAALGLEDYYDPRFERYASKYFDFTEIRRKMNEMKKNNLINKARINIRQFIIALYNEVNFS